MSDYRGVKFYGERDMTTGIALNDAEKVLKNFDSTKDYLDINQVLELYNIQRMLDSGSRLAAWTEKEFAEYQDVTKKFPPIIGRFFSDITGEHFTNIFSQVDIDYIEDFWTVFTDNKVYLNVPNNQFSEFLNTNHDVLLFILRNKNLVTYYGTEIAEYMIKANESAELLMTNYLSKSELKDKQLYFQKELSEEQRREILKCYVDSENANPNYLKLLTDSQSTRELPIDDKLRLNARRRYKTCCEKYFSDSPGFKYGVEVSFASQESEMNEEIEGYVWHGTYSQEWIRDNRDYPTLLNNFIFLFNYTDFWLRSRFPSLDAQLGILEKALGIKGNKEYLTGIQFGMRQMAFSCQMRGYCHELKKYGIEIENVIKWFFESYLPEEFHAYGFIYNASSEGMAILGKLKMLAPEIDSVLKQYRMYCEDNEIDRELFEMSSEQIIFSTVPSMQKAKYAYSASNECRSTQQLLFSDQSGLTYTEKTKSKYHALAPMIVSEPMFINDFHDFQQQQINWLVRKGIVKTAEGGQLSLDYQKAFIFKELFENEVVCLHYCTKFADVLNKMQRNEDIRYEATLFSEPEQKYLDFMLNKHRYSNGYDLRNKYMHGTYPLDVATQETDYVKLLKIMVMVIIKINEEFCLCDDMKSTETPHKIQFYKPYFNNW